MVHKGEGGQICPKIGPHGLRMLPKQNYLDEIPKKPQK